MKLISLNIWGGKIYQPLIDFIRSEAEGTDIFCFQEVFQSNSDILTSSGYRTRIYNDIASALKNFDGYFAETFTGYDMIRLVNFDLHFGLTIFAKKSINVISHEETFIHYVPEGVVRRRDYFETSRGIQCVRFNFNNKMFNAYNLHGLWIPGSLGKKDNQERLLQSAKIESFMQRHDGEKIVVGDFNLDPETQSLKILERNLKNLIKEYSISTTRSTFYTGQSKFADYTLVSPRVNLINFQVPAIAVSDHLPMILEFD